MSPVITRAFGIFLLVLGSIATTLFIVLIGLSMLVSLSPYVSEPIGIFVLVVYGALSFCVAAASLSIAKLRSFSDGIKQVSPVALVVGGIVVFLASVLTLAHPDVAMYTVVWLGLVMSLLLFFLAHRARMERVSYNKSFKDAAPYRRAL